MFYQEALHGFLFSSCVNSLVTIGKRHWRKLVTTFVMPFMLGAYFCMGAYKHDVVAVIEMGVYIHGCLFSMGAYPDFTVYI